MDVKLSKFIEFFSLGPEVMPLLEVESFDPLGVEVPENADSFRYFEIYTATIRVGTEFIQLRSEPRNYSNIYYYGGVIYDLKAFINKYPHYSKLIESVERDGCENVINTRLGGFQQFNKGDVYIDF